MLPDLNALTHHDVLADGTRLNGVAELRAALLKRPEIFLRTLTENLMIYALGRGLDYRHCGQ